MSQIESIAQDLLALDEEDLTIKLGLLEQTLQSGTRGAKSLEFIADLPEPRAGFSDLLDLGKNVFGPASAEAYRVLCTDVGDLVKDSDLATELTKLMAQKTMEASTQAVALLTPILTSAGLPQSVALMVGTLLVKKLAKGSSDFICTKWKQNIEGIAE